MLTIREATLDDAIRVSLRLRKADREEIEAASGRLPVVALTDGFVRSKEVYAVCRRDIPIAVGGIVPASSTMGIPWLLGTDDITRNAASFARLSRPWIDALNSRWPLLFNVVDARNTVHIRWLRWVGFRFVRRIDSYGAAGLPFYEFARIDNV